MRPRISIRGSVRPLVGFFNNIGGRGRKAAAKGKQGDKAKKVPKKWFPKIQFFHLIAFFDTILWLLKKKQKKTPAFSAYDNIQLQICFYDH